MVDVAVVIINYIQYVSIKKGLEELRSHHKTIDIYCQKFDLDSGFNDMSNNIQLILKKDGWNVLTEVVEKKYCVLLEPYPCMNIDSKYKIRYRYSNISAKPNVVYKPENYILYDGVLCSGIYDSNYLSNYTKTYIVPNMKYTEFCWNPKLINNKKVLVYLPTYGEYSSIDDISEGIKKLKKEYYIIVKIHHGTTFLKNEKERIDLIKNAVDEFYDSSKDIQELLSIAHVVLTDNSGSIFDSLFAKVPVCCFCEDINVNKLGNFNSIQFELYKQGILPYANSINKIKKIVLDAQSERIISLQNEWSNMNFSYSSNPERDFFNVINLYLSGTFDKQYFNFHREFSKKYYSLVCDYSEKEKLLMELIELKDLLSSKENKIRDNSKVISDLEKQNRVYMKLNNNLESELYVYKHKFWFRVVRKMYAIIGGKK